MKKKHPLDKKDWAILPSETLEAAHDKESNRDVIFLRQANGRK